MRAVVYHNYGGTDNLTLTTWPDPVAGRGQVLINGAGVGSGPLVIQLAKAAGADVTAVDTAEKASFMIDRGADRTIDYRNTDFACEDARHDLIVDPVSTRPMRRIDLVLAPGGHYRLIGGTMRAMFSALIVGGARGWIGGKKMGVSAAEGDPDTLNKIGQLALDRKLTPQIAGTVTLEDVPQALAAVGAGATTGKLVVLPNGYSK